MRNRGKVALCVLLMVIAFSGNLVTPEYPSILSISEESRQFQGKTTIVSMFNEIQVNNYTTFIQEGPSVSALTADTFVVAWQSYGQDGQGYGVYATVFNATTGENLTPEFPVSKIWAGNQVNPSVCALTADTFAVAWQGTGLDGSGYGVYAAVFNATTGENLTAELQMNAYTVGDQSEPSVSALTADTFAVAWHSEMQDGSDYGVYAAVFNAMTGKILTAEFQVNTNTTSAQRDPSLSALTADTFAVVWQSYGQDGSSYGVYAAVFNATTGENLTAEFQVNTYTTNAQLVPSVSALTADTFAVAWQSDGQDGSDWGVYAAVFNTTTSENLTAEFQVNTYTTNTQEGPSVSALTADTFLVAWQSYGQDGQGYGVYATVFNATTGENLTAEFQVNAYTADYQWEPSVSALTTDTFAVAWHSDGQDGSDYGVYAAVFGYIPIPLLDLISPTPSLDGIIQLKWSAVPRVLFYYVFRAAALITDITGLVPIAKTIESNFTDICFVNGEYFYIVVAENIAGNSSISNCENITILMPFASPILSLILPETDEDGIVDLKWSKIPRATTYYIFRVTSYIFSTEGLTPIASVTGTNYTDQLFNDDYYFYAVVAGDGRVNSSVSNCQYVLIAREEDGSQSDDTWLFILTIVAGFTIAGAIIVHGLLVRASRSVPPPPKKALSQSPKN